jgi:ComF family protein
MLRVCRGYRGADAVGRGITGAEAMPFLVKPLLAAIARCPVPGPMLGCGQLFRRQALAKVDGNQDRTPVAFYPIIFARPAAANGHAVTSPLCSRCGMVFKSRVGGTISVAAAWSVPGPLPGRGRRGSMTVRCGLPSRRLNSRATRLANPLGRLLFATYRRYWPVGDIDLIAPVPLHRRRFRRRGFNQAFLLVKAWPLSDEDGRGARSAGKKPAHATPDRSGPAQRRINIKNAFCVSRTGESTGKRILLVDDVLTTGATAEACAAALLKDGARRVDVLTLARA